MMELIMIILGYGAAQLLIIAYETTYYWWIRRKHHKRVTSADGINYTQAYSKPYKIKGLSHASR